ncbi:PQQ-dependent sugar dehydrogenase [Pseudomonadota bacterium]
MIQRILIGLLATGLSNCTLAEEYRLETWADGLALPWSIAFLPDGSALVTELGGQLRRIDSSGKVGEPIENIPVVYFAGQGGVTDQDQLVIRWILVQYVQGGGNRGQQIGDGDGQQIDGQQIDKGESVGDVYYHGCFLWVGDFASKARSYSLLGLFCAILP